MRRKPTLVIASATDDLHADIARSDLVAEGEVDCWIVHTDDVAGSGRYSWDPVGPTLVPVVGRDDKLPIDEIDAIWWRRSGRKQRRSTYCSDISTQDLIDNDSHATLLGCLLSDFTGRWLSDPIATSTAENKLLQLRAARGAGLTLPKTLVSQEPVRIRQFYNELGGEVIVKAVRGTNRVPIATQPLTDRHLQDTDGLALCPAIFQERIPGRYHLRVLCFGRRAAAAIIDSADLDWRPLLDVKVEEFTMPNGLQEQLESVLRTLGLRMGVFDLKLDSRTGKAVWLEVNPQGQFFFLEGLSKIDLRGFTRKFLAEECRDSLALHTA